MPHPVYPKLLDARNAKNPIAQYPSHTGRVKSDTQVFGGIKIAGARCRLDKVVLSSNGVSIAAQELDFI